MDIFTATTSHCSRLLMVLISTIILAACQTPPPIMWDSSTALDMEMANQTKLGLAIATGRAAHADKSGIYTLGESRNAFASRMLLAGSAEQSLDLQYYIWRKDITGTLLLKALLDAAERGVRVRLLLDDMNDNELEPLLLALNSHNNVQIRLFNPFIYRSFRIIDYITAFSRVNRRMHNKSFTVDNTVTIVGGRNIGDEYFGASDDLMFSDVDVLAIGPVVADVSTDFDRYWASESSFPLEAIIEETAADSSLLEQTAAQVKESTQAADFFDALEKDTAINALLQQDLSLVWAATYLISDDPAKGVGKSEPEDLLSVRLSKVIGTTDSHLTIVSSYFVPTKAGAEALANLAKSGIKVTILTNSLEATDVAAVHAGYAKYRKQLVAAGVQLFEMRAGEQHTNMAMFGSSAASLHAKTFAIDSKRIFIGSFNFDPRSANLNTELGFVIESPELTKKMEQAFADAPEHAYRVMLTDQGDLYWLEQKDGEEVRYDKEPNTSWWVRFGVSLLAIFPIEWLL
jgi:cardiolipin synthase C